MKPGLLRTFALISSMVLGALAPQAHAGAWAIRWLVVGMLFLVFLQTRLSRGSLRRSHGVLIGANVAMGFAAWGLGWLVGGRDVALAAFFAGITPTATAAPVVVSFLRGRVDYVIAAFLVTNLLIAALLPALLPLVLGQATPDIFARVLGSVCLVVFVPLGAAWGIRAIHPPAATWPRSIISSGTMPRPSRFSRRCSRRSRQAVTSASCWRTTFSGMPCSRPRSTACR